MRTFLILLPAVLLSFIFFSCSAQVSETYVSLGDSLAVGVGSTDPVERGYAPLYRQALEKETGRDVRFVQLGIAGETGESFIDGYPGGSQLSRAEGSLRQSPGSTVTLSLGGNDLMRTAGSTDAEREAAIETFGQNLDFILRKLNRSSDPVPRVIVLAYYNPSPGSFTDRWVGRLNEEIRSVAERNGASVAAGDRAFADRDGEYTRHDQYPWDIHPTDAGYEALTRAFIDAEDRPRS